MKRERLEEKERNEGVFGGSCLLETYIQRNRRQLSLIKQEMIRMGLPEKEVAVVLCLPESFIRYIDNAPENKREGI